jgi:hypothetical protein
MGMQKLPVLGTFIANQVPVPGQTGPNYSTGVITDPAANRVTISRFKLTVATSIVVTTGIAVVTCANHLNTKIGQQVTFSGGTGAAGLLLNNQTWTISSITSSSVYSFPCNLPDGSITGTIVQEPVFTLPAGFILCTMDANANVEMCVDNTYNSPTGYSVAGVATAQVITPAGLVSWQILITGNSTPVVGLVVSDGFATRIRCMGTTASSYFSVVA